MIMQAIQAVQKGENPDPSDLYTSSAKGFLRYSGSFLAPVPRKITNSQITH
jgi:hypothetical protein